MVFIGRTRDARAWWAPSLGDWGVLEGYLRGGYPPRGGQGPFRLVSAAGRLCGRPSWLPPGDPGGPSRRQGPPRGGGPLRGGKAAAVTKIDVKARETQVAVVPSRPSPPPPCQSLTRASSWTACAWQGRHMRAWARARAWSGKARASWARSYRTVGSRSSMRATGGAFSANLPPPPLLFGFGVRELVIRDGVRTSNGQRRRRRFGDHPGNQLAARLLLNGCLPIIARAISAQGIRAESGNLIPKPVLCEDSVSLLQPCNQLGATAPLRM